MVGCISISCDRGGAFVMAVSSRKSRRAVPVVKLDNLCLWWRGGDRHSL